MMAWLLGVAETTISKHLWDGSSNEPRLIISLNFIKFIVVKLFKEQFKGQKITLTYVRKSMGKNCLHQFKNCL